MGWSAVSSRLGSARRALTALAVVALALAGCVDEDARDTAEVPLSLDTSPISELLGIDIALRSGDLVELERSAERGVVECMKERGFEYIPIDLAAQFTTGASDEDPDSREWAERNGYGISVQPEFETINPEDLVDPNDAIRAELSPPELGAYELALYGDAPVAGEELALEERTGCVAESYRAVYSVRAELGGVEEFFTTFAPELEQLEDRFRSDPRFVALEERWAVCMADKGYPFARRDDIFGELRNRMSEIQVPDAGVGDDPPPEVVAAMDAVADWERAVAVADWDCTQPVEAEMAALRYGYEALFLEENRDRIGS